MREIKLDQTESNFQQEQPVSKKRNRSETVSTEHLSLEDIVHLTNKVGMEYVAAKKEADKLDLLKPTVRARVMLRHEEDGKKSEAKIKRLAETDSEYVEYLEKLSDAKAEFERLRMRYESYKNLFDARRSMLSYQKAEMNLI